MPTFVQPSMLYFVALAAIPGILYLLFRLRRRDVGWGATYVLRLTLQRRQRRSRWKQVAIIALRTVLLAVLVAAFARPLIEAGPDRPGAGPAHPAGTLHRVVLIDNSPSMRTYTGQTHRLDAAREVLAALLAGARPGDTCHVIPMSPQGPEGPTPREVPCPISLADASALAAEIAPQPRGVDLSGALRAAVRAFRDGAAAHRQLIILSDLARNDHPRPRDYEVFAAVLERLGARVATLNLASPDAGNVAVEALSPGSEVVLAGQPTNIYLEVVNYSDRDSGDVRVELLVDGKVAQEQNLALPAGHRKTLRYPVTLAPGAHRLEARISDDAYAADNRIRRFITAKKGVRVLIVSPETDGAEPFEKEEEFLARALRSPAPFELDVESLPQRAVTPAAFRGRDVVFVCGAAKLSATTIEALAGYVRRGGGLILSVAPGLDPDRFNQTFAELLPARLDRPFRAEFNEDRYVSVQPADLQERLLREFETGRNGDLSAGRVYNHFRLAPPAPQTGARALLRLSNGDPLLMDRPYGQGRVLLWTTSLGGRWTSLVVHQAWLPLIYRLINYAAGFAAPARNVRPGQPLICRVPADRELFVTTPDKKLLRCPPATVAQQAFVRFEQTEIPGTYELRDADDQIVAAFSVAAPTGESDLRTLRDEHAAAFERSLHTKISHSSEQLSGDLSPGDRTRPVAGWLLMLAAVMLLLDALLTRVWFR